MSPSNWLITGGCGFIGTSLVKRLAMEGGHCIRILDNLEAGTREALSRICAFDEIDPTELPSASSVPVPGRVELIVGDIRDADLCMRAARGTDGIIHLAANTGVAPSLRDPRLDLETNVMGTFNLLDAARGTDVKRFVFASSGAPVGECTPPVHEELAPRPISPYGAGKLCGEAYCSAYFGSFGLDTVALRFGNVYGPRSSHKGSVVAKFIRHILAGEDLPIYGDGRQTRDFIYVDDLVNAILLSLDRPAVGGEVFQIATHREHTVDEVAEVQLL